jgi:DNA-binding transcriptional MerR regulator/catechol 2,3-dioxygenase-like lactoylglutathione lyase family enzyme
VSHDDLLSIGGFSMVSGLSVTALRYYDEVGILAPAYVDPATGYRRYRLDQLGAAETIRALRRIEVPVQAVREILAQPGQAVNALRQHRATLTARAHDLSGMVRQTDQYIEAGGIMTALRTARIVQVTINVTDVPAAVAFYQKAFGASYQPEISSLQFGDYPDDDFFLLTIEPEQGFGPSRFGLTVAGVDDAHRRALAAGGAEVRPPADAAWKPRSSEVRDPSGNNISLFEGYRPGEDDCPPEPA